MFSGLKKRWKVNVWQLLLILITFAAAGSATGFVGKFLMDLLDIQILWLYILIYVVLISLVWPMMVITCSIVFGQFHFFKGYLKRMGKRIFGRLPADQNDSIVSNKKV